MDYSNFTRIMRDYNEQTPRPTKPITGVVVFEKSNFNKEYSEIERSYEISSDNKAFIPGMCGYSIFASCLDGVTDRCVRLEAYIKGERGSWTVENCYFIIDENKVYDFEEVKNMIFKK